jgi:hypothetical protein
VVQFSGSTIVKLLQQMYTRPHWIDLIRLFGYQTLAMSQAKEAIRPLAQKYGNESLATACEALVEISMQDSEATARLKPHVRQMAFQILGAEPTPDTMPAVSVESTSAQGSPPEVKAAPKPKKQKSEKKQQTVSPAASPLSPNSPEVAAKGNIVEQYRAAKERHPDMLLLFRMGDFYELFAEDAEIAHKLLGLTLTTRDRTLAMAGFPHHQLEGYLHQLLKLGQRVAICDQVDESLAPVPIGSQVARIVTSVPASEQREAFPRDAKPPKANPRDSMPRKPRSRKKSD